ncbi:zinc finger, CCHC-type containing protein [Tanacetum coccineum]
MHFLLTTLKVVYVLTTPMLEFLEDDTVEATKRRAKWGNNDYIYKGHILNGMSDPLFDIYQNVESAKELWDSLESKYMAKDASSKTFLVSNFNNYKMVDYRPVMEQFNELLRILRQYIQHGLKMDESTSVSSMIDKLPPSWKDFKHSLKHGKDDLSLVQVGSHLRIEESLRAQESDKGKGKEVARPSMNMMEEGGKNKNNKQNKGKKRGFKDNGGSGSNKKPKLACWKCGKTSHFKKDCRSGNKKDNTSASAFYVQVDAIAWWIDSGVTTNVSKDLYWFKTYEPVEDGSVLYMGDDHFTPIHGKGSVVLEFRFGYYNNGMFVLNLNKVPDDSSSVYMSSYTVVNSSLWHARLGHVHYKRILEMSKDDLIPAIDENPGKYNTCMAVVRLPDPQRKTFGEKGIDCILVGYAEQSNAYRFYVIEPNDPVSINTIIESRDAIFDENRFSSIPKPKDIIPNSNESQRDDHLNDVPTEGSRDQIRSQNSYCYSIEEDPRTYNEAMQSRDIAF